jgi:hypothetical protein
MILDEIEKLQLELPENVSLCLTYHNCYLHIIIKAIRKNKFYDFPLLSDDVNLYLYEFYDHDSFIIHLHYGPLPTLYSLYFPKMSITKVSSTVSFSDNYLTFVVMEINCANIRSPLHKSISKEITQLVSRLLPLLESLDFVPRTSEKNLYDIISKRGKTVHLYPEILKLTRVPKKWICHERFSDEFQEPSSDPV